MYEIIDSLQESDDYYYIDYIPYNTKDSAYLQLEDYFVQTYLHDYSQKIIRIMLKLIYYYQSEVYLTEPTKKTPADFDIPFDTNIRDNTPEKLADVINQVILQDFSSIQILFSNPLFLISICGEFSVTIYKPNNDTIQLLNQLVQQEGLFLKKHGN